MNNKRISSIDLDIQSSKVFSYDIIAVPQTLRFQWNGESLLIIRNSLFQNEYWLLKGTIDLISSGS